MRCCTVIITDTDYDWLCTALEVRTNWCTEYTELILIRWLYTDNRVAAEHIWTDVQGCTGTIWWYPVNIRLYCLYDCINPLILRIYRHLQTLAGICHTGCI